MGLELVFGRVLKRDDKIFRVRIGSLWVKGRELGFVAFFDLAMRGWM